MLNRILTQQIPSKNVVEQDKNSSQGRRRPLAVYTKTELLMKRELLCNISLEEYNSTRILLPAVDIITSDYRHRYC